MEPLGWDADDCAYFVLDDDRLYRRTDAPLPPEPKKSKSKKPRNTRSNKRRRVSRPIIESSSDDEEAAATQNGKAEAAEEDDGFGGMKWKLIAITLDEYNAFLDTIRRSRDPNEKVLRARLTEEVLPIIEKRADQLRQKEVRRLKELENLQKLATAKRSSRLANKAEARKEQEEVEAAEKKRVADLEMAKREQEKQRKLEDARESRMMTREQRIKDREVKRILQEEELKRLEEDKAKIAANVARGSERYIKSEMERRQNELKSMGGEDDDWYFDCAVCGVHGQNLDDGSHSIECERCKVWQHSACHNISEKQAENDNFHFVCNTCKRKDQKAKEKIPPLKLNFSSPKMSSSPPASKPQARNQPNMIPPNNYTHPMNGVPPMLGRTTQSPPQARPSSNGSGYGGPTRMNGQGAHMNGLQWQPPQTSSFQRSPYTNGSYNGPRPANGPSGNAPSQSPPIGTFHHYRPSSSSGQSSSPPSRPPFSPSQASNNLPRPNPPSQSSSNYPGPSYPQPQSSSTLPRPAYPPTQTSTHAPRAYYPPQSSPTTSRSPYAPPQSSSNPKALGYPPSQGLNNPSNATYPSRQVPGQAPPRPSHSPPQMNGHAQSMYPTTAPKPAGGQSSSAAPPSSSPYARPPQFGLSTPRPAEHTKSFTNPFTGTPGQPASGASHSPYLPGLSPSKQESPRPASSHSISGTPILPPVAALSPSMGNAPNMSPPVKKPSPTHLPPILNMSGAQAPPAQLSPKVVPPVVSPIVPPSEKLMSSEQPPQPHTAVQSSVSNLNGHQQ